MPHSKATRTRSTTLASTATKAQPTDAPQSASLRLLLFAVGGTVYGCDIATVREIVSIRPATRLPGAPSYVLGLINLRGAIVTVIDLAARLAGSTVAPHGSVVLAEYGSKQVGIAVDEVRDVEILALDRFEPASGDVARGGIVSGLGHLDAGVVIVLDVPAVVRQVMA
jgi:purine-binding chemotaxis protein CheW